MPIDVSGPQIMYTLQKHPVIYGRVNGSHKEEPTTVPMVLHRGMRICPICSKQRKRHVTKSQADMLEKGSWC